MSKIKIKTSTSFYTLNATLNSENTLIFATEKLQSFLYGNIIFLALKIKYSKYFLC
jgi:hypothetical protein